MSNRRRLMAAFSEKQILTCIGNEIVDIDGNNVTSWTLIGDIPVYNSSWTGEIVPLQTNTKHYVICPETVIIKMKNEDITTTSYNTLTNIITIDKVDGNIIVEAEATEIIQFEDSIAKNICVTNWGGNYVSGEITAKEASLVTNIKPVSGGNRYFNGSAIYKFNEFRYFTGITALSNANTSSDGTFQSCVKLNEITLPKLNTITSSIFNGSIFRRCRALKEVDLTPWSTSVSVNIYSMFNTSGAVKVDLRPFKRISSANNIFACTATYPSNLVELDTRGCTFGATALQTAAFSNCNKLTTINGDYDENGNFVAGGFVGHKGSISLQTCPLTTRSVITLLLSLSTANSGATITLRNASKSGWENDSELGSEYADAVQSATGKGYTISFA